MSEAKQIEHSRSKYFAVQLTDEEWDEQGDLTNEYIKALGEEDEVKSAELRRRIIFPSYLLRGMKKLEGAEFIREQEYNTVDADLVFGPGWLDEDDGGPVLIHRRGYGL